MVEVERAERAPRDVGEVAADLGLAAADLARFGDDKAKVRLGALERLERAGRRGRLVLVTAMSPTPRGEGKTTVAIGLADGLRRRGARVVAALRQPSLGPVLGLKGGATGGGRASLVPAASINLHFTGDLHAVTSAHDALAALLDNHIHHGNPLGVDVRAPAWRRVIDMNDRALRRIVVGLGGRTGSVPRESGFDITAASEVMAILALASGYEDLVRRLGAIIVGFDGAGRAVRARDLEAEGALGALLRDALEPNLVQTLEGTPALVHAGPFANVGHGTCSLVATRLGLAAAEVVLAEAGFGCDLGGEKWLDLVTAAGGPAPEGAVLVATVRALRWHGDGDADAASEAAVLRGLGNLAHHAAVLAEAGVPAVVALNLFPGDTEGELALVERAAEGLGLPCARFDGFARGGEGGLALAAVLEEALARGGARFRPLVDPAAPIADKIEGIARAAYGADGVDFSRDARADLDRAAASGLESALVCMCKTPLSLTGDPARRGAPRGFRILVREVRLAAGAGFVIPIVGALETLPGLPARPNAERIRLRPDGEIEGLA